jgi:hypothetical protein
MTSKSKDAGINAEKESKFNQDRKEEALIENAWRSKREY